MIVVLCLYDRDWNVRFVEQYVVRLLRFTALDRLTTNDDAALCEITLLDTCVITFHFEPFGPRMAGVMNFVRMSVSVRSFLFTRRALPGTASKRGE